MQKVKDDELKEINGGISTAAIIGIGLAITFIAGVLDGIARPQKCRN